MNRPACPPMEFWHRYVDGLATATAESDRHLRDCTACRDALRDLRRVESFLGDWKADDGADDLLQRTIAAATAEAAKASSSSPTSSRFSSGTWFLFAFGLLAFVVVLVLTSRDVLPAEIGSKSDVNAADGSMGTSPQTSDDPASALSAAPIFRAATRPRFDAPEPFSDRFDRAITRSERVEDVVRRVETLLRDAPPDEMEYLPALERLLAAAGPRAEAAVHRALRSRPLTPELALGVYRRMTGVEATRALVRIAAERPDDDAAAAELRLRPAALDEARTFLGATPRAESFGALCLVARLGGAEVAEDLAAEMRRRESPRYAAAALAALGTPEALLSLAKLLPGPEEFDVDRRDPESAALEEVVRTVADVGVRAVAAAQATTRASERRRFYLLAGLSGDVVVRPSLEAALERTEDRTAAAIALRLLQDGEAAPALVRAWRSCRDRTQRRRIFEAVLDLSGPTADVALGTMLEYPEVRAGVLSALSARPEATSQIFRALAYPDVRPAAAAVLRERFGRSSPKVDDPAVWARFRNELESK